jgi:hypothetical protein
MMRIAEDVIERQVAVCADAEMPVAELIAAGISAELLDDMILIGRMYVGATLAEHQNICAHIHADREMRRLIYRLQRRSACQ